MLQLRARENESSACSILQLSLQSKRDVALKLIDIASLAKKAVGARIERLPFVCFQIGIGHNNNGKII
jgi:hypothetical protein